MSYPYDELQGIAFQLDVQAAYQKAGQPLDLANVVWSNRMTYDAVTLDYPASRAKHLRELYIALGLPIPFEPAPRYWSGNMCGVRVPGLPIVSGGAADPSLVLSWFYDRYNTEDRVKIRAAWRARHYTHVLLSWPDSRAFGWSPAYFQVFCQELIREGFFPCVMLCSKDHDPTHHVEGIIANIAPVLSYLVGTIPAVCIGWELSLWLNPSEVQQLIDTLAPQFTSTGARVYVHFQEGYMSFPQPGDNNAAFWALQVGKLTGVLHQRRLSSDVAEYLDLLNDCLERMAGNDGMPADSGFGHPFDLVALEITAQPAFNGTMTESQQDVWGQAAINAPHRTGPAGEVMVMGSGNGFVL